MEKKKLLFVYYKLFKPGGINRVLTNLVNELAEEYDITILLLMARHDVFYKIDDRVKIVYIDSFSHWAFRKVNVSIDAYLRWLPRRQQIKNYFYDFGAYRISIKWLEKNHLNYDTIITCQYKLSAGASLHKTIANKTIAWEHNPHTSGGFLWGGIRKKFYKRLKFVIATNKDGEKYFKDIKAQSEVIYNIMNSIVSENNFIPQNRKQKIISLIVRLVPEKNVLEFLDIVRGIFLPISWKVQILGDGPLFSQVQNQIHKYDLQNKIELLGSGTIEEVYTLMSKSKIVCLTSTNEALPTVLIEGMFFSDALIAYDCNFGPADIINEKNGFLIPLHDKVEFQKKLQYLIDNPDRLKQLAESSFNESKKWKKENLIQKWKEIL